MAQLGSLDAPTLAGASLVLLAETALTAPQAALLTSYVNSGGRLVAMRPDPQLAPVLGITVAGGTTTDGYTLVDPSNVGAGLQAVTLPFKGIASHFTLNGATQVAALYMSAGARSEALDWIERGLELRDSWLVFLKDDPRFEDLHGEVRFTDAVRRMQFPA